MIWRLNQSAADASARFGYLENQNERSDAYFSKGRGIDGSERDTLYAQTRAGEVCRLGEHGARGRVGEEIFPARSRRRRRKCQNYLPPQRRTG